MYDYLSQAFITLFVIIDPVAVVPAFVALTRNDSQAHRRAIALKAIIIATIVLLIFAFVGEFLLDKLGITEPAFKIAGGLLLLLASIDMVVAKHSGISSTTQDEAVEATQKSDISVFPLAIPLIAGPGALTTVIMLMRNAESVHMQGGVVIMLILVLFINYTLLRLAGPITKMLGVTGTNVVTRILGIILAGLAVQFILTGLHSAGLTFLKEVQAVSVPF